MALHDASVSFAMGALDQYIHRSQERTQQASARRGLQPASAMTQPASSLNQRGVAAHCHPAAPAQCVSMLRASSDGRTRGLGESSSGGFDDEGPFGAAAGSADDRGTPSPAEPAAQAGGGASATLRHRAFQRPTESRRVDSVEQHAGLLYLGLADW